MRRLFIPHRDVNCLEFVYLTPQYNEHGEWGNCSYLFAMWGFSTNKYGGLMTIGFYKYILYSFLFPIYDMYTKRPFFNCNYKHV